MFPKDWVFLRTRAKVGELFSGELFPELIFSYTRMRRETHALIGSRGCSAKETTLALNTQHKIETWYHTEQNGTEKMETANRHCRENRKIDKPLVWHKGKVQQTKIANGYTLFCCIIKGQKLQSTSKDCTYTGLRVIWFEPVCPARELAQ